MDSGAFRIDRLTSDDARLLKALRVEATQEAPTSFYPTWKEEMGKSVEEYRKKLVWNPNNFVFGAFDNTHLVGIAGMRRESGVKVCHTAIVWGVYVKPLFRGRAVATQLLATIIDVARGIPEVCQIKLRVHTRNESAKRVYHSIGFKSYAIDQNVLRVGDMFIHEELMILILRTVQYGGSRIPPQLPAPPSIAAT